MITLISPFPVHSLPRLWRWIEAFRHRLADDAFPKTIDEFIADWELREKVGRRSWAVVKDEEIGGAIMSFRLSPWVADFHAVYAKHFWGRETTDAAADEVCSLLFEGGISKITSVAFADNHSAIAIIRRVGGTREGLLPRHVSRNGVMVDLAVMGLGKERFYELRNQRLARVLNGRTDAVNQLASTDQLQPAVKRSDSGIEHNGADVVTGPVGTDRADVKLHLERAHEPIAVRGPHAESGARAGQR